MRIPSHPHPHLLRVVLGTYEDHKVVRLPSRVLHCFISQMEHPENYNSHSAVFPIGNGDLWVELKKFFLTEDVDLGIEAQRTVLSVHHAYYEPFSLTSVVLDEAMASELHKILREYLCTCVSLILSKFNIYCNFPKVRHMDCFLFLTKNIWFTFGYGLLSGNF